MALAGLSETERRCLERYLAHLVDVLGDGLEEVAVFGSAARAELRPPGAAMRSDVDLLVLTSSQLGDAARQQLVDATYPLFLECGRQLAPQFRTRKELVGAFADEVERDGVRVWRRR